MAKTGFRLTVHGDKQIITALNKVIRVIDNEGDRTAFQILNQDGLPFMQEFIISNTDSRSANGGNGIAQNLMVGRKDFPKAKGWELRVKRSFEAMNPGELEILEFGYEPHFVTAITNNPKGQFPKRRKQSLLDWYTIHGFDVNVWGKRPLFVHAHWSGTGLRPIERTFQHITNL